MNIINAIRSAIAGIFLSISLVFQPQAPLPTPTPIPTITVSPTPSLAPTSTLKPATTMESCSKVEQRALDKFGTNMRDVDNYLIANRIDCHYSLLQKAGLPKSNSNIQDLIQTRNNQSQNNTQNSTNNSGTTQNTYIPYTAPVVIPTVDSNNIYIPPDIDRCSGVSTTVSALRQNYQSSIDSARNNAIAECGRRGLSTDSEGCQAYIANAISGPTANLNLAISQYCVKAPLDCPCP